MRSQLFALGLLLVGVTLPAFAVDWGLKPGTVDLQSVGPIAFGPDGILFVSDPKDATIYAIDTGSKTGNPSEAKVEQKDLQNKLQELLGGPATVADLAVNPASGEVIIAATAKSPALVRIDAKGKITQIELKNVPTSLIALPNPPKSEDKPRGNPRNSTVTDLAFINGKLLIAGLSSKDMASTVREISFPFNSADEGTSLEIYHAAHGKTESSAPVQTFVPFSIDGEPSVLAGFTCTPLVKFPIKAMEAKGEKIRGTTVAELGNRNKPIDMIVYQQGGKTYLLMANSARGVMKISTENLGKAESLTTPVSGGGTAGQKFETIEALKGVVQLDKLNDQQAVILVQRENALDLQTIALP